jgi:hypothetical protein
MSDPNNAIVSLLRKINDVNLRLAVNSISPSPLSIRATTKTFRLHSRHRGLFSTCVLLSYTDRTVVELAAFRVDDYIMRGIIPFITKQHGQPSADLVQYCHQNDSG